MKELEELERKIKEELALIRNKETKSANDYYNYEKLQEKLRKVNSVKIYLKEMNISEL